MNARKPHTKKPMTPKQAQVMRVLRNGGILFPNDLKKSRYRVQDLQRNPVMTIQNRTYRTLVSSSRIIQQDDGNWVANPKRRNNLKHT